MRLTAVALGLGVFLAAAPLSAQESFYLDGNMPVDRYTSDSVDAYMIYKEQLDHEEADRREQFEAFIYQERPELLDDSPAFGHY